MRSVMVCRHCGERIYEGSPGRFREVAEGIDPSVCTESLDHRHRPVPPRKPAEWFITRRPINQALDPITAMLVQVGVVSAPPSHTWVVIHRCQCPGENHGDVIAYMPGDPTVVGWAQCVDALSGHLREQR